MCYFKTAIVRKDGKLFHLDGVDSHEDIIQYFKLKDDDYINSKIIRVEFSPENKKDLPNIKKYKLIIDEKSIPDWFNLEMKEKIERQLSKIVSKYIITKDMCILPVGFYILSDDIVIENVGNSVIEYIGNSTIKYAENCMIKSAGNCTIEGAESCTIENAGNCKIGHAVNSVIKYARNCRIKSAGNCTIEDAERCKIEHANNCKIEDARRSVIKSAGKFVIKYAENSTIEHARNCVIKSMGNCNIKNVENCKILRN